MNPGFRSDLSGHRDPPPAGAPSACGENRVVSEVVRRVGGHALQSVSQGVLIAGPDRRILWMNAAFTAITGYREEEMLGRNCRMLQGAGTDPGTIAAIRTALATGVDFAGEILNYRKDGSAFWNELTVSCLVDEQGALTHFVGITRDITARKEAEQRVWRSEANLASAQRIAHLGSWELDLVDLGDLRKGALRWSDEVFRIWGYEPGGIEVSYENFLAAVHPDDRGLIAEAVAAALRENRAYDLTHRIVRPGGGRRFVREQAAFQFEAGTGRPVRMIGTVLDVTEQIEAEQAVKRALERLMEAQRIGGIGDWERDLAASSITWSPQVFEIFGRNPALGPPKDFEDQKAMFEPGSWSLLEEKVARAIRTGEPQEYELAALRPDGTRVVVQARAAARRGEDGRVAGLYGTVQDITERKKLEAQFLRGQRQESLGTLAGGVAHDLNNIFAPILLVVPLLRDERPSGPDGELLNLIEQSARRGAKIIKQLLTFSRGIDGERGPVNAGDLIGEMVTLIRETFPRDITIKGMVPAGLWPISADATQIHQVLLNLCVNARDAMPKGGDLTIAVENKYVSEDEAARHSSARPGPHLCLAVSDTGEGIARENLDRIFEPFFTTKEIGKGTGLGLSTAFGIVKSHGGFITVYSEPGRGTVFRVFLPAGAASEAATLAEPVKPAGGAGQLILIVDDEPAIRKALRLTLEQNHYRVVVAADADEALGQFSEGRERPSLVLTDIMMPGRGGVALIERVRELAPGVAIVAATGLHDQARREKLAALGVRAILAKPCSADEVLAAIHHALTSRFALAPDTVPE